MELAITEAGNVSSAREDGRETFDLTEPNLNIQQSGPEVLTRQQTEPKRLKRPHAHSDIEELEFTGNAKNAKKTKAQDETTASGRPIKRPQRNESQPPSTSPELSGDDDGEWLPESRNTKVGSKSKNAELVDKQTPIRTKKRNAEKWKIPESAKDGLQPAERSKTFYMQQGRVERKKTKEVQTQLLAKTAELEAVQKENRELRVRESDLKVRLLAETQRGNRCILDDSVVHGNIEDVLPRCKDWSRDHTKSGILAELVSETELQQLMGLARGEQPDLTCCILSTEGARQLPWVSQGSRLLVEGVLSHFICREILLRPLWFLEQVQCDGLSISVVNVTMQLYKKMSSGNSVGAKLWLADTVRAFYPLATTTTPGENPYDSVRDPFANQKEQHYLKLAKTILSGSLRHVVKNLDDKKTSERKEELINIFRAVGELAIRLWAQNVSLKSWGCYRSELQHSFSSTDPYIIPHNMMKLKPGSCATDGKPIQMCVRPAILATCFEQDQNSDKVKIWSAALVWINSDDQWESRLRKHEKSQTATSAPKSSSVLPSIEVAHEEVESELQEEQSSQATQDPAIEVSITMKAAKPPPPHGPPQPFSTSAIEETQESTNSPTPEPTHGQANVLRTISSVGHVDVSISPEALNATPIEPEAYTIFPPSGDTTQPDATPPQPRKKRSPRWKRKRHASQAMSGHVDLYSLRSSTEETDASAEGILSEQGDSGDESEEIDIESDQEGIAQTEQEVRELLASFTQEHRWRGPFL